MDMTMLLSEAREYMRPNGLFDFILLFDYPEMRWKEMRWNENAMG